MPPFEEMDRDQDVVLFPVDLVSGIPRTDRHGEIVVQGPTQLRARWTYVRKNTVDAKGNPIKIDAQAVVDQVIVLGSKMLLSPLISYAGVMGDTIEFMDVIGYHEATDIRNRVTRRTVDLMRYRGSISILSFGLDDLAPYVALHQSSVWKSVVVATDEVKV